MGENGWIEVSFAKPNEYIAKLHLPGNHNVLSVRSCTREGAIAKLHKQIPRTIVKLKKEFAKYSERVTDRIELYEKFLRGHHVELLGDNTWKTKKDFTDN